MHLPEHITHRYQALQLNASMKVIKRYLTATLLLLGLLVGLCLGLTALTIMSQPAYAAPMQPTEHWPHWREYIEPTFDAHIQGDCYYPCATAT